MNLEVKGFPNVRCEAISYCSGSQYATSPSRKVGYITLSDFRSWDNWTYTFYDKTTGKKLGSIDVEVDHKKGYRQDPPPALKQFKKLMARVNENMAAVQLAIA